MGLNERVELQPTKSNELSIQVVSISPYISTLANISNTPLAMTDPIPPEIPPPEFQPPGEEPYVLNNSLLPMSVLLPPPITMSQYGALGGGYGGFGLGVGLGMGMAMRSVGE